MFSYTEDDTSVTECCNEMTVVVVGELAGMEVNATDRHAMDIGIIRFLT